MKWVIVISVLLSNVSFAMEELCVVEEQSLVDPKYHKELFEKHTPYTIPKLSKEAKTAGSTTPRLVRRHSRLSLKRSHSFTGSFGKTPSNGSPVLLKKRADSARQDHFDGIELPQKEDPVKLIQQAVQRGDVSTMSKAVEQLKEEERLDKALFDGTTALRCALEANNVALALMLLKHGAAFKDELLLRAAATNRECFCSLFLEKGAQVTLVDDSERTVLHYAAQYGFVSVICSVLKKKSSLFDQQDNFGYTPLMVGCIYGRPKVVELLLEKGADLVTLTDQYGNSGLHHFAASVRCKEVAISEHLPEQRADKNEQGYTPLMVAVARNNKMVSAILHAHQLNECLDRQGNSVLHLAAKHGDMGCASGDVSALLELRNSKGLTPLMIAAEHNHSRFCSTLLELGASVMQTNDEGDTVLHLVARLGSVELVKLFLGQDELLINKPNEAGDTPLVVALRSNKKEMVEMLMFQGADTQRLNVEGKTFYDLLPAETSGDKIQRMKYRCSLCKTGHSFSATSFLCDVAKGHLENVRMHLNNNILIADSKNKKGLSALAVAAGQGHLAIVKLLISSGVKQKWFSEALEEARKSKQKEVGRFFEGTNQMSV